MVRYRRVFIALLTLLAIPSVALAGGWAIASFDDLPREFVAGTPYALEYTILQHGRTPVDVGSSRVRLISADEAVAEFEATRIGGPGRYRVTITFPEAGAWRWEVTQGEFAPHGMGSVNVAPGTTAGAFGGQSLFRLVSIALALAVILTGLAAAFIGRRRSGQTSRVA